MKRPATNRSQPRGFALVITLSLMILLTVVAVGLLSLSAVTMRAARQQTAQAEARANARLALIIAIGELQKQMGPDQRVSANGAILAESTVRHPHWTGVWNSWRAGTMLAGTTSPDAASEHRTIMGAANSGMSPTYVAQRKDHFRSWLVSLDQSQAGEISSARNLALDGSSMPAMAANAVELVGKGSLGAQSNVADSVQAGLIPIGSDATGGKSGGRFAWWVGDESQKARIMDDPYQAGAKLSLAERLFRHQAPGATGTSTVKGLEHLKDEQQLKGLPTLQTLDVVGGVAGKPSENYHSVTPFSYQVLADVREGGLKRDLTTLLERPINIAETGDDFMLYRFDTDGQERVPIQDLAAFYQLYNSNRPDGKDGMKYTSNLVANGLQVIAPDYGNNTDTSKYLRNYTTLYRRPVPIKVQFLLGMTATSRTPTPGNPDTHKLQLGIIPAVTLWNPTNVPMVMNFGDPSYTAGMLRLSNLPVLIRWNKNNGQYVSNQGIHMRWATQAGDGGKANIFSLYFSGTRSIVFRPGEVRVFSLPYRAGNMAFGKTDNFYEPHEVAPGWDPSGFLLMPRSDRNTDAANVEEGCLTFKAADTIAFKVTAEDPPTANEIPGSGLQFFMIQTSLQNHTVGLWHFRDYQFISRYGSGTSTEAYNISLISKGFPGGGSLITAPSRSGSSIIAEATNGGMSAFLQFALMAGCETNESSNGGSFGGRKFASRPFLHSTAISPSFIDKDDNDSFYHYGWNWWVEDVNSIMEANVQVSPDKDGYYGGGYTPENGTTHVVQQEVPAVPTLSIASLSHAHLGGFSLATEPAAADYNGLVSPYTVESFQRVTATGQAGLLPHTLQAIGNSYAHPYIPADKGFTTWSRLFSVDVGPKQKTLADHSYLANKALWDEFFFSSISPAPSGVQMFGQAAGRSAEAVAKGFFFKDEPLPNRRMVPFTENFDENKLSMLFQKAQTFNGGLADRIAAHLMVEGPFNVNSTSVEAWKVFLSSLKGKSVAYLNKDSSLTAGLKLDEQSTTGTPVGPSSLPNGKPGTGSTNAPSDTDQWTHWRELSDKEIEELATAMVKQVKLRGPFLALSEFVNRRLASGDKKLTVMGALQAALDDDKCSINAGFRSAARRFSAAERSSLNPAFPEALEGPVAYGSSAYVDQADILRNFAEQITPRGDTFVIRTYGDALDANGKVEARAWCEAVVQRVPDYLDATDEPQLKTGRSQIRCQQSLRPQTAHREFPLPEPHRNLIHCEPPPAHPPMTIRLFPHWVLCAGISVLPCLAQEGESVTLQFLSFPRAINPEPVELVVGEGKTIKVETPTNELSAPYKVKLQSIWQVGETVVGKDDKPAFKVFGQATALASSQQLILLVHKGKTNSDGFDVIPIDYRPTEFGGGKFLFMNAAKIDIAGVVGSEKFVVKPGQHSIIKPKADRDTKGLFNILIYFRKDAQAKPFFSSTWPLSDVARSLIFFYHDPDTKHLRLHTIRDFP